MRPTVEVVLPGGYWVDGECHHDAELRPLSTSDEEFVFEMGDSMLPVQLTTALLARCVTRLGPTEPVTADEIRSLRLGDREALLLHLRRLTVGDRLSAVMVCTSPGCGQSMDIECEISGLLLPPYSHEETEHEITLENDGRSYRVRFRSPTGGDLEDIVVSNRDGLDAATSPLLKRCVLSIVPSDGDGEPIEDLPLSLVEKLSTIMSEYDPQSELVFDLECPDCGSHISTLFDTFSFFIQELDGRIRQLYHEVHLLAFYYHWSEADILEMPSKKRRIYLDLLHDTLTDEAIY